MLAVACQKENDPPAPIPGLPPSADCGVDGARLTAEFDGSAWCANVELWASAAANEITISGLTSMGSTLTLQLDSLWPGTYAMTQAGNSILVTTSLGMGYMSTNAAAPTLIITHHDTIARNIKGTFSGDLYTTLSTEPKPITGSFDMNYPVE